MDKTAIVTEPTESRVSVCKGEPANALVFTFCEVVADEMLEIAPACDDEIVVACVTSDSTVVPVVVASVWVTFPEEEDEETVVLTLPLLELPTGIGELLEPEIDVERFSFVNTVAWEEDIDSNDPLVEAGLKVGLPLSILAEVEE
jgi:hypothetical protein